MDNIPDKEIRPLTSLRFVAVLAVFLTHLFNLGSGFRELGRHSLFGLGGLGYAAVTYFFTLSGFILCYSYQDKFVGGGFRKAADFWLTRFARVYPVHLLTFLVSIPLFWNDIRTEFLKCLLKGATRVLLIQSFVPSNAFFWSFNGPSWSISDEMFFYLMFPFILWAFRPAERGVSKKVLFGSAVAGIGYGLWITLLKDYSLSYWMFYIFPIFRLLDFMTGMLLFAIYRHFSGEGKCSWGVGRWTGAEIVSILLLWLVFKYSTLLHPSFRLGLCYLPFVGLSIYVFAHSKGLLSSALSHPVLHLLGKASYSFYMFHMLVFHYLLILGVKGRAGLMGPLSFGSTVVLSLLCYRFYELPMKKEIKRFFLGRYGSINGLRKP